MLFDYRPEIWYRPATLQVPPDPAAMTPETRNELLLLARYALDHVAIDPRTRELLEAFVLRWTP